MNWQLSHRADPLALPIADRHYNRQKPGTPQFVPPGRCIVLRTIAVRCKPENMPEPEAPLGAALTLELGSATA